MSKRNQRGGRKKKNEKGAARGRTRQGIEYKDLKK